VLLKQLNTSMRTPEAVAPAGTSSQSVSPTTILYMLTSATLWRRIYLYNHPDGS
jgi:hypothetical protein